MTILFENPGMRPFWPDRPALSTAAIAVVLLSWYAGAADEPAAPVPLDSRAYFRLAGIDDSQFERLTDGAPWGGGEDELLWRILYRSSDFTAEDYDRWRAHPFDAAEFLLKPEEARGRFFGLSGRLTEIERIVPPEEVVRKFEIEDYYRCRVTLEGDGLSAIVFVRTIPSGLRVGEPPDARAAAVGCFLKWARAEGGPSEPVFAAPRLEWFPDTPLGNLGFDAGLLDALADKKPLLPSERECFYQVLAAAGRAKPGSLLREAQARLKRTGKEAFSAVPLFTDPEANRGKLFAFTGTVRRVVRVVVEDPDIVRRFGIHEYYEIALFTEDSQGNPLIFCVRSLPPGMPTGESPDFGETLTVAGFFLKTWAFHSAYAARVAAEHGGKTVPKQIAPLLIGREPVWHPRQRQADSSYWGLGGGLLFLGVLLVIWLVLRKIAKQDALYNRRRILQMSQASEPGAEGQDSPRREPEP